MRSATAPAWRRTFSEAVLVLGVFAAAGLLAGLGWYWWWTGVPDGVAYQGHPYFLPDMEFRSTATYVAIAGPLGLVLGALLTWRVRRDLLVTVLLVLAGSILAGGLMILVGRLLGPAGALEVARQAKDGTAVAASLRVQPGAAWLVLPAAAMASTLGVLLSEDTSARDPR